MKYVLLFIAIQIVSFILALVGIPVVFAVLLIGGPWPSWAWLWFNDEDQYGPKPGFWNAFNWLALRNNVANFKHVRYVSGVGRPLYYRTWTVFGRLLYAKAGWLQDNGHPVFSAGAGRGY